MDEMKVWKCGKGHSMGVITRNGNKIQRLLVYRHAIDVTFPDGMPAPDVMMVLEGHAFDIECDLCGEVRTWTPDEDTLRHLTDRIIEGRSKGL